MRPAAAYLAGAAAIAVLLVFPPWRLTTTNGTLTSYLGHRMRGPTHVEELVIAGMSAIGGLAHIDVPLLAVEILAAALISALVAHALK